MLSQSRLGKTKITAVNPFFPHLPRCSIVASQQAYLSWIFLRWCHANTCNLCSTSAQLDLFFDHCSIEWIMRMPMGLGISNSLASRQYKIYQPFKIIKKWASDIDGVVPTKQTIGKWWSCTARTTSSIRKILEIDSWKLRFLWLKFRCDNLPSFVSLIIPIQVGP